MNKHEQLRKDSRAALAGMMTVREAGKALFNFGQAIRRAERRWLNIPDKLRLICDLAILQDHYRAAITYTLPTFTFRDHLRDCFGWLTLRTETKAKSWTEILFNDWMQKAGLL